jgi:hypothetical protein
VIEERGWIWDEAGVEVVMHGLREGFIDKVVEPLLIGALVGRGIMTMISNCDLTTDLRHCASRAP